VRYEWDFDGDGNFDFNTANPAERPTFRYNPALNEVPRVYTARLRVTDDQNPALVDTKTVSITVDSGNVPPVAVITPNPEGSVNTDIALTRAASFDPNAGAPLNDRIVRYEWDVDDSNGLVQFVEGPANRTVRFGEPCGVDAPHRPAGDRQLRPAERGLRHVNVLCNQPPVPRVVEPNPRWSTRARRAP
jgi:PKD repeat protein